MSKTETSGSRRAIPAVEKVLQALGSLDLPRPVVVALIRRELTALRSAEAIPTFDTIMDRIRAAVEALRSTRLQPVINGTGILVHTNLGRSPLAPAVIETLSNVGANYNNLEFDLTQGERGARAGYLETNLAMLCGAEAATVVNNCAAALVLMLRHFTRGDRKEVIISRGELVQIGGGFRIPEILEASGARLREVGATNTTTLQDYERAMGSQTAMILKVHRSNFFMDGFVDAPTTEALAALAKEREIPFAEDLGSGAVVATEQTTGVEHEPTPAEVLGRGVDLVCFSGDKLLGGPQAGIIAGRAPLVAALKREPFFRALRCDKLILAALQTTVDLYLDRAANEVEPVPVLQMMRLTCEALRERAAGIVQAVGALPAKIRIGQGQAQIGGGTLPRSNIASVTLEIIPEKLACAALSASLRANAPPVIGYISGGAFKLDLRTIFPGQDQQVIEALRRAMS